MRQTPTAIVWLCPELGRWSRGMVGVWLGQERACDSPFSWLGARVGRDHARPIQELLEGRLGPWTFPRKQLDRVTSENAPSHRTSEF